MIERITYDQTNTFISQNTILHNFQSGLVHLTDNILQRHDEGLLTGMILIDLQKAFETINYKVLLQRLQNKEFSGLGPTFVTE